MSPAAGDVGKPSGHYIPDVLPMHGPETLQKQGVIVCTEGLSPRPGMPWGGGWLPFSLAFSALLHLASAPRLGVTVWLPSPPLLLSEAWGSRHGTWG